MPFVTIVLSDISAARFWASYGARGVPFCEIVGMGEARNALSSPPSPCDRLDTDVLGIFCSGERIAALVSNRRFRRRGFGMVCRTCSAEMPSRSICRITSNVYVVSPALCLVQLGKMFDIVTLAYFASLFCGIFSYGLKVETNNRDGALPGTERLLERRSPITNLERLRGYAESDPTLEGSTRALRALSYAAERARSPMEIAVCLQMCLPYRYGGYHCEKPLLNHPITISPGVVIEPDLCWPKRRVAIEYLGESAHTGRTSLRNDVRRSNLYLDASYRTYALTSEHMGNLDMFDDVARKVLASLGKRFRPPLGFQDRQKDLKRKLDQASQTLFRPL